MRLPNYFMVLHKCMLKEEGIGIIQLSHSTCFSPPVINCSSFHTFSRQFTPLLWTSEHLFHSYSQYNWTSSGLFLAWERAVGFGENTQCLPKNPWLHLPVFYTLLCSALWKRGLGLGMFLLTERKRKFQPEFIFHLSCMGFDKGCSLVLGR